jgi:hypothetical protein
MCVLVIGKMSEPEPEKMLEGCEIARGREDEFTKGYEVLE